MPNSTHFEDKFIQAVDWTKKYNLDQKSYAKFENNINAISIQ